MNVGEMNEVIFRNQRLFVLVSWRSRAGVQRENDSAEPRASPTPCLAPSKNNAFGGKMHASTQGFFETDRNVGWLSVLKVIKVLGHCTWATPNTSQPKPAYYG